MDKESMNTRKKLRRISSVEDFEDLLEKTMLSEEERQLVILHYREQKPISYIADVMNMSETSVKRKHKKILNKMQRMF